MFRSLTNFDSAKMRMVLDFVRSERERMGVSDRELGLDSRPEPSCIAFGEFNNLLYCQLIYTREGYGNWGELNGSEVLDGLIDFIVKEKMRRGCSCVGDMQSEVEQGFQGTT